MVERAYSNGRVDLVDTADAIDFLGLDRGDVAVLLEPGIERLHLAGSPIEPGNPYFRQVAGLDADGHAVAQPQALELHDRLALRDLQRVGHFLIRRHQARFEQPRARGQRQRLHFVGEAREAPHARDHRRRSHEGAASVLAPEQARLFEVAQRMPHGDARNPQHVAEAVFVGNLRAGNPFAAFDQLAQRHLGLVP
jgi:hypothetical protein